jgi:hypothetical protein
VFQRLRPGTGAFETDRFDGPEISHSPRLDVANPLQLEPGKYEAIRIVFPGRALGTDQDVEVALLNGKGSKWHGPTFTVPESGCVYIGTLLLTFLKVAPTKTTAGQLDLIEKAGQGAAASATILPEGSLLWFVNDVDSIRVMVDRSVQQSIAGGCVAKLWRDPLE